MSRPARFQPKAAAADFFSNLLAPRWAVGAEVGAGGGAHRQSLQLRLPDRLPASLLPRGERVQRRGAAGGGPVRRGRDLWPPGGAPPEPSPAAMRFSAGSRASSKRRSPRGPRGVGRTRRGSSPAGGELAVSHRVAPAPRRARRRSWAAAGRAATVACANGISRYCRAPPQLSGTVRVKVLRTVHLGWARWIHSMTFN